MSIYFTKEHEWVKINEGIGTIGISEYAVHELGDITFVELPKIGKQVKQFELLCAIESVKAASDIFAPISGKIVRSNDSIDSAPEIVNDSPQENGWMVMIEISDESETKNLMNQVEYNEYIKTL